MTPRRPVRPGSARPAAAEAAGPGEAADAGSQSALLVKGLRASLAKLDQETAESWGPYGAETFIVVCVPKDARRPAEHWQVDLSARAITAVDGSAQEKSNWDVVGSAEAWRQVILGNVNISVAVRGCQIRYCEDGDSRPQAGDARMRILSQLLGFAAW